MIITPIFATGVIDTGDTSGNFDAGVVGTGGKFATGVVDTGGNLPLALLTPVANLPPVSTTLANWWQNLPPVSLIPVVHLDLRISPRIFEKI